MSNFNLEHANNLPIDQCKEYIITYFYPLTTSQHVFVSYDDDGKQTYTITDDQIIKKVYFNRLPKDVSDYYFKNYKKIRSLTCELNKPTLFGDYFNTCPSFLHTVKPYESFSSEMKNKVNTMLDCIKTIWASGDEAQYNYIMKWFSNMARGGKNQSVLYLRGDEGIGKSTITDFMMKHVIGSRLSLMSGSGPLLSNFNIILYSKLLVVYEELENFSTSQWQVVSSRIKRDITSTTCTYEKKNETSFVGKNINNIIINSNVDAIKNDEGRRYFILDLSNEMKGNSKFWDGIYKCMNNEVGEAFYSYLHTIDLEGYHDQNFPATQAKQDAIVKRLETVAKFIKDNFILRHRDMVINLQNLYDEYKRYCSNTGAKVEHKIEFNSRMTKYKLEGKKSGNDHNKFNYKLEYLKEVARVNKWLHKTDVYEATADELFGDALDNNIKDDDTPLTRIVITDEQFKDKVIADLMAQVAELKKQLEIPKEIFDSKEKAQLKKTVEILQARNDNLQSKIFEFDYLPEAYNSLKDDRNKFSSKARLYYDKWFATLSPEEKEREKKREYDEGATESENRSGPNYEFRYQENLRKIEQTKKAESRKSAKVKQEKVEDPNLDPFDDDDDNEVEKVEAVINPVMNPVKLMIIELEKQQQEMAEYVKQYMEPKQTVPKKTKIDPKVFELDLSELEDMI